MDSGTTFLLLPDNAFAKVRLRLCHFIPPLLTRWRKMKDVFLKNCSTSHLHGVCDVSKSSTFFDGVCYSLTPSQLNAFPTLTMLAGQFSTINVAFPPSSYLIPGMCHDPSHYSFAMSAIGGKGTIVGDPVMIANLVVYDVDQKRMGFAPRADCTF